MNLRKAPKYLISNYNTCDDKYAKKIFETITKRSERLIQSDKIDIHYPTMTVSELIDVNMGHCEDVSVHTHKTIKDSSFDESRIDILNRVFNNYRPGGTLHSWISYKCSNGEVYHFDSECPWGVNQWKYLPAILRVINKIDDTKFHDQHPLEDPYNDVRGFYGLKNK